MKTPSQIALYGELLTNEQQYRCDLGVVEPLPREHEPELIERARNGDRQARQVLIERAFIHYISRNAARLMSAYSWASARIDYLDLVQEGNLAVLQTFDRALEKEHPLTYVKAVAKYEMLHYCQKHASAIVTPVEEPLYHIDSLDTPYGEEKDTTLADMIEDEQGQPVFRKDPMCAALSYEQLHQAVGMLTSVQQEIVTRLYGICGHAAHSRQATADALGCLESAVGNMRNEAVKKLQTLLPALAQYQELYTIEQACHLLGLTRAGFITTVQRHQVHSCVRGFYSKEDIERLSHRKSHIKSATQEVSQVLCALPGCSSPVQITKYGTPGTYCSARCSLRMHYYRKQHKSMEGDVTVAMNR